MKRYICRDRRCKNYNLIVPVTLQHSCHWARVLGGSFCMWCAGDLTPYGGIHERGTTG